MWPFRKKETEVKLTKVPVRSARLVLLTPYNPVKKFIAFKKPDCLISPEVWDGIPRVRLILENGSATGWHRMWKKRHRPVAIETCAPDENGVPRFQVHKIG